MAKPPPKYWQVKKIDADFEKFRMGVLLSALSPEEYAEYRAVDDLLVGVDRADLQQQILDLQLMIGVDFGIDVTLEATTDMYARAQCWIEKWEAGEIVLEF